MSELFIQKDIAAQLHSLNALAIVTPTTPLFVVLQQMRQTKASCVIVAENQKVIGVFTVQDMLHTLASHKNLNSLPISALMSSHVILLSTAHPVEGDHSLQQLIEQKEQAFERELNYRQQVEADLEKINQTIQQTIRQSVLQQTQYLQDEIERLQQRNQKLENDLQHYLNQEASLEYLMKNRYFYRLFYELKLSLSHIGMAIQMLEIILRQMGVFGKNFSLLDPYLQILKNEYESGMQIIQDLPKLGD